MTDRPPSAAILEAQGVHKSFDEGRVEALRGVDLKIGAGEFVSITGPSGSGKSTLLHLLGGLDTATRGDVLFRNSPLGLSMDLDAYRADHVGFIFQAFHLLPTLRAIENVQAPMLARRSRNGDRAKRAEELLREVGLEPRTHFYPNQLSAGERQRVAIARALANDPCLLLADEPTGNLDSANSDRIMELLLRIQRQRGMTLVIVTHESQIAESASRQVRMRDGRIAS